MATAVTKIKDHSYAAEVKLFQWTLASGETGDEIIIPRFSDVTVQAINVAGGAITIQGALRETGTDFAGLSDPQGNAISFTADGIETVLENVFRLRPVAAGGASGTIVVMAR